MSDKKEYADVLMDNIGRIDDKYIDEAQNYRPRKIKAIIISIASAAAVFAAVALLAPMLMFSGNDAASAAADLYDILKNASSTIISDVPIDGTARLIWKLGDEDEYHVITISCKSAKQIADTAGTGCPVSDGDSGIRIWVTSGNGIYFTPNLAKKSSNLSCFIFDYTPEVELSAEAEELIRNILTDAVEETCL